MQYPCQVNLTSMEMSLSYLISSSTAKSSPCMHMLAPHSSSSVCSCSPHLLPFATFCKTSKCFYAFLLPLSGPEKSARVEAAAPFPRSFLTSASCSSLPAMMWSLSSAEISFPGNTAVLSSPLLQGLGSSLLQPCNLSWESSRSGNRSR